MNIVKGHKMFENPLVLVRVNLLSVRTVTDPQDVTQSAMGSRVLGFLLTGS